MLKMKNKTPNKKDFTVTFFAKKTVQAYTQKEAECIVENSNIIKSDEKIRVYNCWKLLGEGIVINIGAIFQTALAIILVLLFNNTMNTINNIQNTDLRIIGIIVLAIFLLSTIRFAKTVGNLFDTEYK
jgi:hypothetical protein